MRPTSLAKLTLIGIALIGATAAQASPQAPAATTAHAVTAAEPAPTQADLRTALNVKLALLDKLGTDTIRVDVEAHDRTVRLSGTVDKREATVPARSLPGTNGRGEPTRMHVHFAREVATLRRFRL